MLSRDLFAEVGAILTEMGGPGSGHWGHKGRKGRKGGSISSRAGGPLKWSEKEISALHSFTWLASQTINAELREGTLSTTKPFGIGMSNAEQVELIDSAISKAPLVKSDMTLYSKMDAVYLMREGKLKKGETVDNPGYLSTTTVTGGRSPYPSARYRREAVLELQVPKGAKGVLPLAGVSHYPQEKEHLIRRGSKYRIDRVAEPDNPYIDPWVIGATLLQETTKSNFIIPQIESTLALTPEGGWVERGGPGSGHWGHKGRKGKRGGSARSRAGFTIHVDVAEGVKYNKSRLTADVKSIRSLTETYGSPVDTTVHIVESTEGYLGTGDYTEGEITVDVAGKNVVAPRITLGEYRATGSGVYDAFRHEYGHHIFENLSSSKREEFNSIYEDPANAWWSVSGLFERSNIEGFSEAFAVYTSPKYRSGKLPTPLENYMATVKPPEAKSNFIIPQIEFQLALEEDDE